MWKRIVNWYDNWEQEQLDVLADPSLVEKVQPGYRKYAAQKLAELSPIERHELRAFSIKYQGRRLWVAVGKLFAAFSAAGLLLHLAVPAKLSLVEALVLGNVFGFAALFVIVSVWFSYRKMVKQKWRLFAVLMVGAMVGAGSGSLGAYMSGKSTSGEVMEKLPRVLAISALGAGGFVVLPLLLISVYRNRHYESLTIQLQNDAERERLARELSESKLRVLRAQIEPHFLFNTLGAVQQLAEDGAPRAAQLTANLITFLRSSMSELRSDQVTLGTEFRLVESYLQVMKVRLGDRLNYSLQLPEALTQVPLPSMILLTLAENAIKHGIEPSLRGGAVTVSAHGTDGIVTIEVHDTGAGMEGIPGAGVGLDNIRRRLQLAHGDHAVLTVDDHGAGVLATITLPQQASERAA